MLAGGSLAAVVSTPAVAMAATATTLSLDGATTVKTSNKVSWTMVVGWDRESVTAAPSMNIDLLHTYKTGGAGLEMHDWSFSLSASTLKFNAATGVGTLSTGKQLNPVASATLTFKATSHHNGSCSKGSETIYVGSLSGKVSLVTGLKGGGTVGGTLSFKLGKPELTLDHSCTVRVTPVNECTAGIIFASGSSSSTTPMADGYSETASGKAIDYVGVIRSTKLSAPKGAARLDMAEQDAPPATYNSTTKVLSVTTTTAGLIRGSATLSGGSWYSYTNPTPCTYGGKSYKITDTGAAYAKYSSPAGKAISAKMAIGAVLSAPKSTKTGFYTITTVKPA